jgi:hypothetical protein
VDASPGGAGGSFDISFRRHIEQHLVPYLRDGTSKLHGGCWYCRQLLRWEDASFRQTGVAWLKKNSGRCTVHTQGPGPGGGTRHGH